MTDSFASREKIPIAVVTAFSFLTENLFCCITARLQHDKQTEKLCQISLQINLIAVCNGKWEIQYRALCTRRFYRDSITYKCRHESPGLVKTHTRQKFSYRAQGCQERLPDEFHSRGIWVNRIRASAPRRAHSISTCERARSNEFRRCLRTDWFISHHTCSSLINRELISISQRVFSFFTRNKNLIICKNLVTSWRLSFD